jgi:putative two-component system response regulator
MSPIPTILLASHLDLPLLEKVFTLHTDYQVITAPEGEETLGIALDRKPDILVLADTLPNIDAYEITRRLRYFPETRDIPVLFIAEEFTESLPYRVFETPDTDFITRPINRETLLARISRFLDIRRLRDDLHDHDRMLQDSEFHLSRLVDQKTRDIGQISLTLIATLENANHVHDEDTANHIRRIGEYAGVLAEKYGCDAQFVRRIRLFAPLHDVGKVGIPESLLRKPGKLTPDEFRQMQAHVALGHQMLNTPGSDPMAASIAMYHHEKWDGTGYASGRSGYDIPLEARIVSIADVYDALSFSRAYKDAFPEDRTEELIMEGKGVHFEPRLVDLLYQNLDRFVEIKHRFR